MGDHRFPKRVMSGELENAGKHRPGGRRKKSGRTAWQMSFDYLASRGTGAPLHLTLGHGTAQYTKGAVGLWPRGLRRKKMHPINGRKIEKRKRRTGLRSHLG